MTFPTGWSHRFKITIDKTKVTGTPTGFVLLVTKDMLPASVIDAGSTSAQDGGGDIRFTTGADGTGRLPVEVVDFHPDATSGNRRCKIFVGMNGNEPTTGADKVIYGWCKGPTIMQQPAPSNPYGSHAVWSPSDYRAVHHMQQSYAPQATSLWLMRDRAVEYNGKTYVVWLDWTAVSNGNIKCAAYNHSTGRWTVAVTVSAADQKDGHGTPTICVDNSGYLHVSWAAYQGSSKALKTVKSTSIGDISAWDSVVTIASADAVERTYPCMLCLSGGTLILFNREDGNFVRRYSTDNGATWSSPESVLGSPGGERVYAEFILGASDRVHVAWHCTSSSATVNGTHIYYAYSDNCGSATSTWSSISGAGMSIPISGNGPSTRATGRVYDSSGFSNCYLNGIAVNGSNAPMISAGFFDSGTPANNRYSTFTDNGSAWTKVDVVQSSTAGQQDGIIHAEGGTRFVSGTTWRVLATMTVSSISEVQEFESTDSGATWSKIADITSSSATYSRMPQYIRGATGPLTISLLNSDKTNADYNGVHDLWFSGTHTDGVAYLPPDIITATDWIRDSTKYRNDEVSLFGTPVVAASPFPSGGYCMQFNGSNIKQLGTPSNMLSGCSSALTVSAWTQFSNSGSTAKVSHRGPTPNASCQFIGYRYTDNKFYFNCGNGTTNKQAGPAATSYTSGVSFRWAGYYDGATVSLRTAKTTVSAAGSLTGPLYTAGTDKVSVGESINGYVDEWRIAPSALGTDLLDTEYDNQNSPSTFATGAEAPVGNLQPFFTPPMRGLGAGMGGNFVG